MVDERMKNAWPAVRRRFLRLSCISIPLILGFGIAIGVAVGGATAAEALFIGGLFLLFVLIALRIAFVNLRRTYTGS